MSRRRQPSGFTLAEAVVAALLVYWAWQHPTWRLIIIACTAGFIAYVALWAGRRREARGTIRAAVAAAGGHGVDYHDLTPTEFEHAIAELCRQAGWRNVEVAGGAGDLGADVTGIMPDGSYGVIQAKRWSNNVGSPVVQTLIGMTAVHHQACVGMLITTSGFTRDAINLANQHPQFVLIDGHDLRSPKILDILADPHGHKASRR